jgi:small conductance mechanosensitive channel
MVRAGQRLHKESADVLGDTQIEGITAFGASSITVRTATRVRPGRHDVVAARLRLLIKESFDQQANERPRRTLVGEPRPPTTSRP